MADQVNPMDPNMTAGGMQQPNINVQEDKNMARLYGNAFSAQVTGNDVILDIGTTEPGQNPVTVSVVGRLYLTHQTTISLVNLLQGAMQNYQQRLQQAQQQNVQAAAAEQPQQAAQQAEQMPPQA